MARPRVPIEGILEGSGASLRLYVNAARQIMVEIADGNGVRTDRFELAQITDGVLSLSSLPVEDPEVAGQAWNNEGIVTISEGP